MDSKIAAESRKNMLHKKVVNRPSLNAIQNISGLFFFYFYQRMLHKYLLVKKYRLRKIFYIEKYFS